MDRRHFIKLGIAGATVAVGGMLAGCAGGAEAPAPRSETHPQPQAETPSTSAATESAAPKGTPVVTGNSLASTIRSRNHCRVRPGEPDRS